MLRKMLTLVALVVVAVAFGAGPAAADNHGKTGPSATHGTMQDGFSDGRLGN